MSAGGRTQSGSTNPKRVSGRREPTPDYVWQERNKLLSKLQARANTLFNFITEDLPTRSEGEATLPKDPSAWLIQICTENDRYPDKVELLQSTLLASRLSIDYKEKFTAHNYIQIADYEENIRYFVLFPPDKTINILYLVNLALLLVNIIELTAEWENKSPEERALAIANIDQVFPAEFSVPGQQARPFETHAIVELRTQIFVQSFKETVQSGYFDSWDTAEKIDEIFKLSAKSKGKEPEHVHPSSSSG